MSEAAGSVLSQLREYRERASLDFKARRFHEALRDHDERRERWSCARAAAVGALGAAAVAAAACGLLDLAALAPAAPILVASGWAACKAAPHLAETRPSAPLALACWSLACAGPPALAAGLLWRAAAAGGAAPPGWGLWAGLFAASDLGLGFAGVILHERRAPPRAWALLGLAPLACSAPLLLRASAGAWLVAPGPWTAAAWALGCAISAGVCYLVAPRGGLAILAVWSAERCLHIGAGVLALSAG